MTENNAQKPTTKPFVFEEAVAEARKNYPKETEGTTFIDGSNDPDLYEKVYNWCRARGCRAFEWENIRDRFLDREMPFSVIKQPRENEKIAHDILVMFPANPTRSFPEDPDKSNFLTFYHELGHIVAPNGSGNQADPDYSEIVADDFAILSGISKGIFNKKDVERVAALRDAGFLLSSGLNHLTSMSLDAIVINPKNIDYNSLTPKEVTKLAEKYAAAFCHKQSSFLKLEEVAKLGAGNRYKDPDPLEERVEKRMHALTEICMNAKPSSLTFYLASRILCNAIRNNGMTYGRNTVHIDGSNPHWQSVLEAVNQRKGDRDIGGLKAQETPEFTRDVPKGPMAEVRRFFTPMRI